MFRSLMLASTPLLLLSLTAVTAEQVLNPPRLKYGRAKQIGVLADKRINESSGLAHSFGNPGAFWTHNDSGDDPRLFLIDRKGQTLATLIIEGAAAVDWEDMASFKRGAEPYLLIADVGDNKAVRRHYTLYLVPEPIIDSDGNGEPPLYRQRVSLTIRFTYEDGPHNCESVAVDPLRGMIYLVSKRRGNKCKVYELPLTMDAVSKPLIARSIARLRIPSTTAMDISPDGLRAIVLTYRHAREYVREKDETWAMVSARARRIIFMPEREQGEAICYGPDGRTLYLTSEGVSQPLWEVPVISER